VELLGRQADAGALTFFSSFLAGGGTLVQFETMLATSTEFAGDAAALGVNAAQLLAFRALGRSIDPALQGMLGTGALNPTTVASVLNTNERWSVFLNGNRTVGLAGQPFNQTFVANNGVIPPSPLLAGISDWRFAVVPEILGRQADPALLGTLTAQLQAGNTALVLAELASSPETFTNF
jgi:hypothetical protein